MSSQKGASYIDRELGVIGRIEELLTLLRWQRSGIPVQVGHFLDGLRTSQKTVEGLLGEPLADKQILVIGPGQRLGELAFFACRNEVTGIDLDAIPQSISIGDYWRMYSKNGAMRTLKTVGRKAVGIDRTYQRELAKQLGVKRIPRHNVLTMDATAMTFPDARFDYVYSHSCFEHLRDPATAIKQVGRVLKPGGVAHIGVHLYTSDNGCHDVRIFADKRQGIPYWSHLRPQHRDKIRPNTYLNEIRLEHWDKMFLESWPGVQFDYQRHSNTELVESLGELRRQNELSEYSDLELLTMDFVVSWKKPQG